LDRGVLVFMRKIFDIYKKYYIMPNLQLHQLRVASVAMQICDSFDLPLNRRDLALGCLLHDMGNIVKFRLRAFPDMLVGQDIDYWEKIQKECIKKYGAEEHEANMCVVKDIGVSKEVFDIVDAVGFHNWCITLNDGSWEHKIASYADSRVAPFGVLSLHDRLMDANKRYEGISTTDDSERDMLYSCAHQMEKDIFMHTSISPDEITESSISKYLKELESFEF
jgi:hypothetical protein